MFVSNTLSDIKKIVSESAKKISDLQGKPPKDGDEIVDAETAVALLENYEDSHNRLIETLRKLLLDSLEAAAKEKKKVYKIKGEAKIPDTNFSKVFMAVFKELTGDHLKMDKGKEMEYMKKLGIMKANQ
jgi:hypothetical protein